ncbi:MAG: hypothetical protein PHS14_20265 [Elusimicrobia bacterium]|nr:hypothetical protein [Elusimicrobiota bacterium]
MAPADLARWFGVTQAAATKWCDGGASPVKSRRIHAVQLLILLEKNQSKIRQGIYARNRQERIAYVTNLRDQLLVDGRNGLSSAYPAARG